MKIKQDTIVRPLPSEKLIKNHERFWRRQLPESFIDFIKVNNGVEVGKQHLNIISGVMW